MADKRELNDFERGEDAEFDANELFRDDYSDILSFNGTVPYAMQVAAMGSGAQVGGLHDQMEQAFKHAQEAKIAQGFKPKSVFDYAVPKELAEAAVVMRLIAPQKPWYILPTNFVCEKDLDTIVLEVHELLSTRADDIDYEFVRHECSFHGVYMSLGKYCDFHIRIYQQVNAPGFLVELQKMERDSCTMLFTHIYRVMRDALTSTEGFDATIFKDEDPEDVDLTWDEGFEPNVHQELDYAIELAKEPTDKSKVEASCIFAEFSTDAKYGDEMVRAVPVLVDLLKSTSPLARQHAMLALGQLSELPSCIEAIRDANVFPLLMSYASEGPYYTAKMRREGTRVIKNLSDKFAPVLTASVGKDAVKAWMEGVKSLTDLRMREVCEVASANLSVSCV